jgi:hypothetical protein
LFFRNDVVQLDLQRERDALRMTASRHPPADETRGAAPTATLEPASSNAAP